MENIAKWMLVFPPPINPLSPNFHIQILQTDLYTYFPYGISWENLVEDQTISLGNMDIVRRKLILVTIGT